MDKLIRVLVLEDKTGRQWYLKPDSPDIPRLMDEMRSGTFHYEAMTERQYHNIPASQEIHEVLSA